MSKLLAYAFYWLGLDGLFYRLNRKAKRIITFHNVLPDDIYVSDVANGVSCSESSFRAIIEELKKRWKFSTDLFDPKTITITFDDGYLNQYETAAKVLKEAGGISSYLFVSGDVIEGKQLMVDRLLHWAARVPQDILDKMGYKSGLELWIKLLWPEFVADNAKRGQGVYERLDKIYPFEKVYESMTPDYKRLRLEGIKEAQLADLRMRGWKIGWHTKTHYPLSGLSLEQKREELAAPEEYRKEVLSYPYGEEQSVDIESIRLAESLDYPCAVSNTISPTAPHGKFFFPRVGISSNKYLMHFELSGAKYFLKNSKLLPRISRQV